MEYQRSSGILLHPTSLPGPYGIGDIGPAAYEWIDFLASAGCSLWQILPLGPTGYGDSPYQAFSAFAGNPYLISPEHLIEDGLLEVGDLANRPQFDEGFVDYGTLIPWKIGLLEKAYQRFTDQLAHPLQAEFDSYLRDQVGWLKDFSLFMAIKEMHAGAPWPTWEPPLRDHRDDALTAFYDTHRAWVEQHAFRQFIFFRQWEQLRRYAKDKGISIIGDAPIFVAHDSADVWAHPELFFLTQTGKPQYVAGVPPDYFSPVGQLWGNPLYRWDRHRATGYSWWISRLGAVLSSVDLLRLDHFRGFCAYWEVPGEAETAENGRWVEVPGMDFFKTVQNALGDLPIIAEDLGVITPDVVELRDTFNLPGMKVVLFAFLTTPKDPFIPHNYPVNCVVYTGTHDNDTVLGWYERTDEQEKDFYRRYMARDGSNVAWDFIRAAWSSVGVLALAPMQDFLGLGNAARMNYPGNPSGNWSWRMKPGETNPQLLARIREINYLYDRENPVTLAAEAKARQARKVDAVPAAGEAPAL